VKHPKRQDFVQQLRATQHPRREPLAEILESAPIASETILAKRLEAVYQRLQTLRARAVRYRMTDREERALETLLSLAVDACWEANPELTDEEKGGMS
jgi:hypothetical protein